MLTSIILLWTVVRVSLGLQLEGGGASFPAALYDEWFKRFSRGTNLKITYQVLGSSKGKAWIKNQLGSHSDRVPVFVGSDTPFSDKDFIKYKDLHFFPIVGGAVVVVFNIPGIESLNLGTEVLAKIYNGTISNWNDKEIQSSNWNVSLPDRRIRPIARRDGSGTTEIFTEAMASSSQAWNTEIGIFKEPDLKSPEGPSKNWPENGVEFFASKTSGVAALITSIPNTIGYMSIADATESGLKIASIENSAGHSIRPEEVVHGVQEAMDYFAGGIDPTLTVSLINAPISEAYPISLVTYMVVNMTTSERISCDEMKAYVRMVRWILTSSEAEETVKEFSMVPLTSKLVEIVQAEVLNKITCKGDLVVHLIAEDDKPSFFNTLNTSLIIIGVLVVCGSLLFFGKRYRHHQMIMKKSWLIPESDIMIGQTGYEIQCDKRVDKSVESSGAPSRATAVSNRNRGLSPAVSNRGLSPGPHRGSVGPSVAMSTYYARKSGWLNGKPLVLHKSALLSRPAKFDFRTCNQIYDMTHMNHENLAPLMAVVLQRNGSVFHAMSLAKSHRGTLHRVLKRSPYEFNEQVKLSLAMDVCNGLSYLHKHNIIHGFLDPWNCVVDNKWVVKLTNWTNTIVTTMQEAVGTLCCSREEAVFGNPRIAARMVYRHPDYYQYNEDITSPEFYHDVYSYGMVLSTILSRSIPFRDRERDKILEFTKNPQPPIIPEDEVVNKSLVAMLGRIIRPIPSMQLEEISHKIQFHMNSSHEGVLDSLMHSMEAYIESLLTPDEEEDRDVGRNDSDDMLLVDDNVEANDSRSANAGGLPMMEIV